MSDPAPLQWLVARNGVQAGPYSTEQVVDAAAKGLIVGGDLMWKEGMSTWEPAYRVSGVFPEGSMHPPSSMGDDPAMRWIMPVGRSGWAIAAGYLGLFAVLVFPAPFALVVSIIAIIDIKKHPDKHGMGRAIFGLVMGAAFTALLVIAIVANMRSI